ncbi:MAG: hypothetical protein ACRD6R_02960, partial [Candidatus Polarisedimenticolia bacterium]
MLRLLWLIPVLPLAGFLVNGLAGTRLPRKAIGPIAAGAVLLAFLLSLGAIAGLGDLAAVVPGPGLSVEPDAHRVVRTVATWMPFGTGAAGERLGVDWAFALDPLSAVMLLVVTGVGFLIHVYSIGYMAAEPQAAYARFFAYLNLFMAMMLT